MDLPDTTSYARLIGFSEKIPLKIFKQIFGEKAKNYFLHIQQNGDEIYDVNRPKAAIQPIIDYALTGQLHIPKTICMGVFVEELKYWRIPLSELERCCFFEYKQFQSKLTNMHGFEVMTLNNRKQNHSKQESLKFKIWKIVDRRNVTKAEKIYSFISILFILLAGINTTIMTMHLTNSVSNLEPIKSNISKHGDNSSLEQEDKNMSDFNVSQSKHSIENILKDIKIEFEEKCGKLLGMANLFQDNNRSMDNNASTTRGNISQNSQQLNSIPLNATSYPMLFANMTPENFQNIISGSNSSFDLWENITFFNVTNVSLVILQAKFPGLPAFSNVSMTEFDLKDLVKDVLDNIISKMPSVQSLTVASSWKYYDYIELATSAFFTVEITFRIFSCPEKKIFFQKFMNILEILLVTTQILRYVAEFKFGRGNAGTEFKEMLEFVKYIQIFRVFRLIRCVENVKAFKVLEYSFKNGKKDFGVLLMYIMIGVLILGNFVYFVEDEESFPSIPAAYYWSIITMTTVGYGDMTPKSTTGKTLACIGALLGLLLFSLVVPIVVRTFLEVYESASSMRSQKEMDEYEHKQNILKNLSDNNVDTLNETKTENFLSDPHANV